MTVQPRPSVHARCPAGGTRPGPARSKSSSAAGAQRVAQAAEDLGDVGALVEQVAEHLADGEHRVAIGGQAHVDERSADELGVGHAGPRELHHRRRDVDADDVVPGGAQQLGGRAVAAPELEHPRARREAAVELARRGDREHREAIRVDRREILAVIHAPEPTAAELLSGAWPRRKPLQPGASASCASATSPERSPRRRSSPPAPRARSSRTPTGRRFIDFAGGLGCLNFGHNPPEVVAAIHAQADQYLHQCFMVAMYEPYVEVCQQLAELSPCRGRGRPQVDPAQLRRRGGGERGQGRARLHRPPRGHRVRPLVPRPHEPDDGDDLEGQAVQARLRPARARGLPRAGAVPVPRHLDRRRDRRARARVPQRRRARGRRVRRARAGAGRGRLHPDAGGLPAPLQEVCDQHGILYVDDEVQAGMGRTGPVWAIEHFDGVEPDILVSGKSLGGGLPLAAITARAEIMDAPDKGGLGGTFGGNPLSCAAALPVLDIVASPEFRERTDRLSARLRSGAGRHRRAARRSSARCAASGAMLAMELDTRERGVQHDAGGARARAHPALVRLRRQRRAHPRPARHRGRRPRARAAHPRRGAGHGVTTQSVEVSSPCPPRRRWARIARGRSSRMLDPATVTAVLAPALPYLLRTGRPAGIAGRRPAGGAHVEPRDAAVGAAGRGGARPAGRGGGRPGRRREPAGRRGAGGARLPGAQARAGGPRARRGARGAHRRGRARRRDRGRRAQRRGRRQGHRTA